MIDVHVPRPTRIEGRDPELSALLGDWLCLDFANSVHDRSTAESTETLTDYLAVVRWGWHARLLTDVERDKLQEQAMEMPDAAPEVYARAIELREAIYRVFAAIAALEAPNEDDLAIIQRAYVQAIERSRLGADGERFDWHWSGQGRGPALEQMLWPIARSAVVLLTSNLLRRVKQCPGCDDCGWLFLDTSKNGTRRWCSMADCGSRAKMRRLYARQRQGAATA